MEPTATDTLDRLQAVLGAVRDFVYGLSPDGRFTFANARLLELWGKTSEQVLGKTMRELDYDPEVERALLIGVRHVVETGTSHESTTHYTSPAGHSAYYQNVLSPVFDAHGRVAWVVGSSRDVTARHRVEAALRSSEARFRAVQETSVDGFMILDSIRDAVGAIIDFRWVYANSAAERIVGKPAGWFVGRRLLEEMPGNRAEGLFDAYVRVVESRTPWRHEFSYRHEGVDVYLRATAAPVDDGFAVTFADLSERRRAEEALAERERRFKTLANAMPQLVFTNRPNGDAEFLNDQWAAFTGRPLAELMRNDDAGWHLAMHVDDVRPTQALWAAAIASGTPYEAEFRLRCRDGTYRWFLTRATPQYAPDGTIERWVGTCTDVDAAKVTEQVLRDQEQALRDADRRKDVFLATLSHELRNPLAPIRTAAQLLGTPGLDTKQLGWVQSVIQRQVTHLAVLLDDLLDVSRITQGKLVLKRERVGIASVIDAAVEAARPLLDRKNHCLHVTLPDTAVVVDADPVRLAQVVSNLLTNAAKYTDPGGRIDLVVRAADARLVIEVRDSGIGIDSHLLPRLFEMFAQLPDGRERAEGGLGIGLALVKGVVELHGGRVSASSDGKGCGSTFSVHLPLGEPSPRAADGPVALPTSNARRRVLVVDDNRDAADLLGMVLEFAGHEVRVAYDARGALSLAPVFRPDAAVLDIGLPVMDGYALARAWRAEPWGGGTTLVALTGWGQDEDRRRALEAGFDIHLTKPVEPSQVESLIAAGTPSARTTGGPT